MPVRLGAALVAEFVGTFALCFVGILAIHFAGTSGIVAVALAHGIILSVMVSATMPTSGGHLNPAVTFGFMLTGKIRRSAGIAYIWMQLMAGIIAAVTVYGMFGAGADAAAIVTAGAPDVMKLENGLYISSTVALLAEIIATFFLVFVIWGTAADPRAKNVGGFAIGLTIAADILAFGGLTGASMNPARSFGPTLIAELTNPNAHLWAHNWIYWVGPLIGGSMAALAYHLALWPRDPQRGIESDASNIPRTQRP